MNATKTNEEVIQNGTQARIYEPANMTPAQRVEWNRALKVWKLAGIFAREMYKENGYDMAFFLVLARGMSSDLGRELFHRVELVEDEQGEYFTCDCQYGKKPGQICVHKMAAYQKYHAVKDIQRAAFRDCFSDYFLCLYGE